MTGVAALLIIIGAAGANASETGATPMAAQATTASAAPPVVVSTTEPAAVPTTEPAVDPAVADTTDPAVADTTDPAVAETTDPPEPSYAVPSKHNLKLSIRTTSKHCFGSAGCNVEYEVKAKIVGGVTFDPSITYDVTIQTRGSDDGPRTDTFTITGDQYESVDGYVSTASANTKLTAVITDVEAE